MGCHFVQITKNGLAWASGAVLLPASLPFSTKISSTSEQIGLQCLEPGVIMVQISPAVVLDGGHMGNVGAKLARV